MGFPVVSPDFCGSFVDRKTAELGLGVIGVLRYTPLIFGILGSAMFQPGMMHVGVQFPITGGWFGT